MNLTKQDIELILVWYKVFAKHAPGPVPMSDKIKAILEQELAKLENESKKLPI